MTGFNLKILVDYFRKDGKPAKSNIPVKKRRMDSINDGLGTKVTWFGHSTLFVEINGKTLFLDPILSKRHGPLPMLAGKNLMKNYQ